MKTRNSPLARQIRALPLSEADMIEALHWMEKGEAIADALIAIARFFRRVPDLKPATH